MIREGERRASLSFIFVALFLDVLGLGLVAPVLPKLIGSFQGVDLSLASSFYGLLIASYALMSFTFASALGSLSDRFGRRPVILLSVLGLGLDYVIIALAPTLAWLVVGRILAGIFGAIETTAFAYVADVSPPDKRAQNFGLLGAAFGIGFIVGPLLGGLLGNVDLRLPFWVAAGLAFLNLLYGLFVLPESLAPERRRPFSWSRANPVGALLALRRFPSAPLLTTVYVLINLALNGLISVWVLYTSDRYGWDPAAVGLSLTVVGVSSAVVQGALVGPAVARFGEARTALLGLAFTALSYALYGVASQGWMLYAGVVVGALGGLAAPAVQGAISSRVSPDEQGLLQGALAGLNNLTSVVAPPVTAGLFAYVVAPGTPLNLPGAPFFLCALLSLAALLVARRAFRHARTGALVTHGAPAFAKD